MPEKAIFLVVLNQPDPHAWNAISEIWPDSHYLLTDQTAFISAPRSTPLNSISSRLGMNPERQISGLVSIVDSYYGWNDRALWDWISNASN